MENIFNDYELDKRANQIKSNLEEISNAMYAMMDMSNNNKSSKTMDILKRINETPIELANDVYRNNIADLMYISTRVNSFDESLKEITDGFSMTIIGIMKFPISLAHIMTKASDIKENRDSPEIIKIRQQLTEISEILSRLTNLNIGIMVKTSINSIQNEIQTIEKKLDPNAGCYIATCVYNDYNNPNVIRLRLFRDSYLSKSLYGQNLIKIYYSLSPKLIKYSNRLLIRFIFQPTLYILIKLINQNNHDKRRQ